MISVYADQALTDAGWRSSVRLEIEAGVFA